MGEAPLPHSITLSTFLSLLTLSTLFTLWPAHCAQPTGGEEGHQPIPVPLQWPSTLSTLFILQGLPTVPSLLGEEKATNPFLRPFSEAIRRQMGQPAGAADWEVFGAVRKAKDSF